MPQVHPLPAFNLMKHERPLFALVAPVQDGGICVDTLPGVRTLLVLSGYVCFRGECLLAALELTIASKQVTPSGAWRMLICYSIRIQEMASRAKAIAGCPHAHALVCLDDLARP